MGTSLGLAGQKTVTGISFLGWDFWEEVVSSSNFSKKSLRNFKPNKLSFFLCVFGFPGFFFICFSSNPRMTSAGGHESSLLAGVARSSASYGLESAWAE